MDLVALINRLRRGSVNHRAKLNFFRDQICDAKSNSVWCCRDGDFATTAELKELNEKNDEPATMVILYTARQNISKGSSKKYVDKRR